ncbi:hypothetical protein E4U17_005559 [Claviceps sp. LM77 group G4]|nr:hypothetical protein E4U33_001024 [Claviceps sp. LM78 group G4]KAG6052666.1 hypothetical protein E4U17_005559 [Claviceps sp. LM77 group G4]KAG6074416.1 hypothetical protein E4U16_003948 [Claviceps sp. LM84 group G4]
MDRRRASGDMRKPPFRRSPSLEDRRWGPDRRHDVYPIHSDGSRSNDDVYRGGDYRDYRRFDDDQRSPIPTGPRSLHPLPRTMSHDRSKRPLSPPPTTMHQAGPVRSNPARDSELKDLAELLCDKMWWRVQCEHETKREKKLTADRDRCPPGNTETAHYSEILQQQLEQCQKAKKLYTERMTTAEGKFITGIARLVEGYAPGMLPPSGLARSGVRDEEFDARLDNLRKALETSVKQRIQENQEIKKAAASTSASLSTTSAGQVKLQKETDELKKSLQSEKQRNDRLEKKLQDMEQRLNHMSQQQDKLAQDTAANNLSGKNKAEDSHKMSQLMQKLDAITVNTITRRELKIALEDFDDAVAPSLDDASPTDGPEGQSLPNGNKTRQYLHNLSSALEEIKSSLDWQNGSEPPRCIADLQAQVSSCTDLIQSTSKQSAAISESLKALEATMSTMQSARQQTGSQSLLHPLPQRPPSASTFTRTAHLSPTPPRHAFTAGHAVTQEDLDKQLKKLSTNLTKENQKRMRRRVMDVAEEFGKCVDRESVKREEVGEKTELALDKIESLGRSLEEFRVFVHEAIRRLDTLSGRVLAMLQQQNEGLGSFSIRLQNLAGEHDRHQEEVALQLRVMNAWQSNFTTKPLYKDIVNEITRTLPNGVIKQVAMLNSRLGAVEGQLKGGDESVKRRRVQ